MTAPSLKGDILRPLWFLFIDTAPTPVRLFSGPASFILGPSGPDAAGGTYLGLGMLVNVPSLKLPINGAFAQHVFALSGVTANIVKLINVDREALRGARTAIGRMEMNADATPAGDMMWLWQGFCDGPSMSRNGHSNPPVYTVSISVSSGSVRRKARQISLYTPSQQRQRDPTDTAMNMVPTLASGDIVTWPVP